jgi:hypothetical protein
MTTYKKLDHKKCNSKSFKGEYLFHVGPIMDVCNCEECKAAVKKYDEENKRGK